MAAVLGMREGGNRRGTPPSHDRRRGPALRARVVLRVLGWLPVRSPAGPYLCRVAPSNRKGSDTGRQNRGGGSIGAPYEEAPLRWSRESLASLPPREVTPPPLGKVVSVGSDRVDRSPSPKELLALSKTDSRAPLVSCQR